MKLQRGFTLIELLIVLTILGLAASLVGPLTVRQVDKINVVKERQQLFALIEEIAFQSYLHRGDTQVICAGNTITAQGPQGVTTHQFAILSFPAQQLQVNSHGFWQQPLLQWVANDEPGQLTLTSTDIISGRSSALPAEG